MKLIFLDTETTGLNTETDRLCQLAFKTDDESFNKMFKPSVRISPEASSVNHISNKMVADKEAFKDCSDYYRIKELLESPDSIMIAHNAMFDASMLMNEGIKPINTLDTLKIIQCLDYDEDPGLKRYNVQYLRYFFDIEVDAVAHSAAGDITVLEKIYYDVIVPWVKSKFELKTDEEAFEKMVKISSEEALVKIFTFGKYYGERVTDIIESDLGYVNWILNNFNKTQESREKNKDILYTLSYLLKK